MCSFSYMWNLDTEVFRVHAVSVNPWGAARGIYYIYIDQKDYVYCTTQRKSTET